MRNRIAIFTLIFVFIFSVSIFAGGLTVVKTVPPNGVKNVDPILTEIKIIFSAPVKMNSWSFVQTEDGEFPETIDQPYFPDNRTCVLPVLLEEHRTYSIGINSATRKGFKSAADESVTVEPYILTFTTGKEDEGDVHFDEEAPAETPPGKYQKPPAAPQPEPRRLPPQHERISRKSKTGGLPKTMIFRRVAEKNENAFTLLIPKGWQTEGGIVRINPLTQGGPAQSVAAKLDFSVKEDPQGTVMARILPDFMFYDPRMSPAGQMGLIPPGGNYMGMQVVYKMPALQFIQQMVFPYAHPQATGFQVKEQKQLPRLAQDMQKRMRAALPMIQFNYDAGLMTVTYQENGIRYLEKIVAVVEDWGAAGAGMWANKETFYVRTPVGEYDKWAPVFSIIRNSIRINPQWLAGEIKGQLERSKIVINTQREIQRIDREIAEHRQITNAEINNDMFLTLTDQEEYVNPFTREVEIGSNQWQRRWENPAGDVIYTNDESYDPRIDVNLNRTDFKLTPVRKRFPR
ncbi:MAG: hypothetical protein Kow0042_22020 [Calditrichia bacterium]